MLAAGLLPALSSLSIAENRVAGMRTQPAPRPRSEPVPIRRLREMPSSSLFSTAFSAATTV
jgi:hypothetical protein